MKTVKKNRTAHRSTAGEIPGAATYGREEMRQNPNMESQGGWQKASHAWVLMQNQNKGARSSKKD